MERITIIGHVGQDAVIKAGQRDSFITFSVAVSSRWKNADDVQMESTQWYNCLYQPKTLTVAQYLKKGTKVFVEGKPNVSQYKNKAGEWAIDFGVQVRGVELLSAKEPEKEAAEPVYQAPETKPDADTVQKNFVDKKTKTARQVVSEEVGESGADDLPF